MPPSRAHNVTNGRRGRDEAARVRASLLALAFLGTLLLVPLGMVLLFPDRALEQIRPWLERVASDRLEGRVRIVRLSVPSLGSGRLVAEGVHYERDGEVGLHIPRLQGEFTFGGLLRRRLERLHLLEPAVTLFAAGVGEEPTAARLPFTIGRLEVSGGRAELQSDGKTILVREVDASGTLESLSPFRATARVGDGDGILLAAVGTVAWGEELTIALQELAWGGRSLLPTPLTISLPEGVAAGTVRLDRFDDRQFRTLFASFGQESPLPAGWGFALHAPEVQFRLAGGKLDARLRIAGATLAAPDFTLPLHGIEGTIEGGSGWRGRGTFRLAGAPTIVTATIDGERWSGTLDVAVEDPAAMKRQLAGGDFPDLAGGFDLAATFARDGGAVRVTARAQGRPGAAAPSAAFDLAPLVAEGRGEYSAAGAFSAKGQLLLRDRELIRFRATATEARIELPPVSGAELGELIPFLRQVLPAGSRGIAGTADLVRNGERWEGDLRLQADRIPLAVALWGVDMHAPVAVSPAATVIGPGALTADLQGDGVSARLALEGSGEVRDGRYAAHLQRITIEEAEYLAADGLSALTGGQLAASGTIAGATAGGEVRVDLAASLGAREFLYGRIYADLTPMPVTVGLRGAIDPGSRSLRAESIAFHLSGIGTGEGSGALSPSAVSFAGTLAVPDLAVAWGGPLGQAVAALRSDLAGLRPTGAIDGDLAVHWRPGDWRLAGEARPTGVDIVWPRARLVARDVRGRIPFDLRSAAPGEKRENRRGTVRLAELRFGAATMGETALTLLASANRLEAESPLLFSLAGGEMEVIGAAATYPPDAFEASAQVRLRALDLADLTRTLGWTEMAGRVSADLGRIRYSADSIRAEGLVSIDAFGGTIRLGGGRLESLFSDYPILEVDAEFDGIDLQQLTRTLEFGEINGIADGYVRGLRLFGTTPSAFEAVIETRGEGRRNISVKALNNLSVLSQGGFSTVLSRGIYRFIDFYRYRKIGIVCSLRRDRFTLHGTARPGSERFLVYGGLLPPKIDIVAPGHTISFKEMLRRLQRIERTEASATTTAG